MNIGTSNTFELYFPITETMASGSTILSAQKDIQIEFEKIGKYGNKDVNCFVTFKNFYYRNTNFCNAYYSTRYYTDNSPLLTVSNNFFNGFWYGGFEQVDVVYNFYYTGDASKKFIKIENTLFTANSLNTNEGIAYITSLEQGIEPQIYTTEIGREKCLEIFFEGGGTIPYVYGKELGEPANGDHWEDRRGSALFENGSASFLLVGDTENKFTYRTKPSTDDSATWVCPSTSPLGTPKLPPEKSVNKTEAELGEEVTFKITQELHETGVNILTEYYTSLKMEDQLSSDLDYLSSSLTINGSAIPSDKYSFNISNNLCTIEFKRAGFLDTLVLNGQKIVWTINCRIKSNTESSKFTNQSRTSFNTIPSVSNTTTTTIKKYTFTIKHIRKADNHLLASQSVSELNSLYTYDVKAYNGIIKDTASKKVSSNNTRIVPLNYELVAEESNRKRGNISGNTVIEYYYQYKTPTITETIVKTGTGEITDKNQEVSYKITYTISIKDYIGKSTISIEDTLPYTPSEVKENNGGTVEGKKIKWSQDINNINTYEEAESTKKIKIVKQIKVVYGDNLDFTKTKFTNKVKGQIKLYTPTVTSNGVETTHDTIQNFKIKVTVNKEWVDPSTGVTNRRPGIFNTEKLRFKLYANNKYTEKYYEISNLNAQKESVVFEELDKYTKTGKNKGKEINYTVKEVTRDADNLSLSGLKPNKVNSKEDLRCYIETITKDYTSPAPSGDREITFKNIYTPINISGNVWLDLNKDGIKRDEANFAGVTVQLEYKNNGMFENYQEGNNNFVTRTDKNGNYTFSNLPWNGTYKVKYIYNGQIYEATSYMNNLAGGYSNARELEAERTVLNNRFKTISAFPNNYAEGKRAFGIDQNIKNLDGTYSLFGGNPVKFSDILNEFNNVDLAISSYNDIFWGELTKKIKDKITNENTAQNIITYLKDCILDGAETTQAYSINNPTIGQINTIKSVDFGLAKREKNDLAILTDVTQIDYLINGKSKSELFDEKIKSEVYTVENRKTNNLYNSNLRYQSNVLKSDYLYTGDNVDSDKDKRKLSIYVTYRIRLKNNGETTARIKALDDYYDNINLEYDSIYNTKLIENTINNQKTENLEGFNKLSIIFKNPIEINPGASHDIYVTYKVQRDSITNRIKINNDIKNISEINKYETDKGIVDTNSDPGNFVKSDIDESGLKYSELYRIENDTDQSPKLKLAIDSDQKRSIKGFVFEDERDLVDENLKTVIGNGIRDNSENLINGVTVQLVELVREIDDYGKPTDNYIGEYIWSTHEYTTTTDTPTISSDDKEDYYSGSEKSKVIITGKGDLEVTPTDLATASEDSRGKYQFDSIPPGDYYIRFTYGDTTRTILTDQDNAVFSVTGYKGLNSKSYNGQDFKSTIYQQGVNQNELANYNGISGYVNFDAQNFINSTEDYENYASNSESYIKSNIKNKLYVYSNEINKSNAKDLYGDRVHANSYSQTINNHNGEVLQSFEKLASSMGSDPKTTQEGLLNELAEKTKMRAQTGVMHIEVEHDNNSSNQANLGLTERPRSQVTLNKEIVNVRITAINNQIVFDTSKSVNNFYFGKHTGHNPNYNGFRLDNVFINKENESDTSPDLIQAYIDNELMSAGRMQVLYKIVAQNIGEVDYTDSKFYYTGIEDAPNVNISKTNVTKIVDYIQNSMAFEPNAQQESDSWSIKKAGELIDKGFVTSKYKNNMETYNNILVSEGLTKDLLPEKFNSTDDKAEISLVLQTGLSNVMTRDAYVYNNLAEIIEITNTQGRRSEFSIPGNQEMQDQNLGNNARTGYSTLDRKTPTEIDADSSQKITLLPPTGEENYTWLIIVLALYVGILASGGLLIKKLLTRK